MPEKLPYPPHPIHRFYNWLDSSRFPAWLFYVLSLIVPAIVQHLIAWNSGVLNVGEFNTYLLFSAIWAIETLLLGHFHDRRAGPIIDGYRSMLEDSGRDFSRLRYEFSSIPNRMGTIFLLIGFGFGIVGAFQTRSASPEIHYVFPLLNFVTWGLSSGIGFLFSYQLVRQLRQMRQMGKHFMKTKYFNLFDLSPFYAFSRYTATIAIGIFTLTYITPLLFDPISITSSAVNYQVYIWIIFSLMIFYLPLREINRRLIAEKAYLLAEANDRIKPLFSRIHSSFDNEDYQEALGMRALLASLKDEVEIIEGIPTWPWEPATLRVLLSAVFLPMFLWLVQQILERVFGF